MCALKIDSLVFFNVCVLTMWLSPHQVNLCEGLQKGQLQRADTCLPSVIICEDDVVGSRSKKITVI